MASYTKPALSKKNLLKTLSLFHIEKGSLWKMYSSEQNSEVSEFLIPANRSLRVWPVHFWQFYIHFYLSEKTLSSNSPGGVCPGPPSWLTLTVRISPAHLKFRAAVPVFCHFILFCVSVNCDYIIASNTILFRVYSKEKSLTVTFH